MAAALALAMGCTANAEPPKFPDMTGYVAVDPDDYKTVSVNPGRPDPLNNYYFRTPGGIGCGFIGSAAVCSGNNFPGVPPAHGDPSKGLYGVNVISTDSEIRQSSDSTPPGAVEAYKLLPPLHTITVSGVTCGVDDAGTTACKNPKGGAFVLSKSGASWLPKA